MRVLDSKEFATALQAICNGQDMNIVMPALAAYMSTLAVFSGLDKEAFLAFITDNVNFSYLSAPPKSEQN